MFIGIANLINKWPKVVLMTMLALLGLLGGFGTGVIDNLSAGGFEDTNSDSYKASQRLVQDFDQQSSNLLLLVSAKEGTVDQLLAIESGQQIETELKANNDVKNVVSYWSSGNSPALKSKDGTQALIVGSIEGDENHVRERAEELNNEFAQDSEVKVEVGGAAEINRQLNEQIEKDLQKAELIALPITLLILLFVFRSVVAAFLPILIGVFAIFGSLFVLAIMQLFTDVNVYALNLTTMLGLGLAIDYSLFIVSRFREQLAKGESLDDALTHTLQHAGHTVLYSALTVAVSLAALIVFPQTFLRSFAFAGVAVSIVSAIGAIFLLPAILRLLGHNINKGRIGRAVQYEQGSRFWHNVASYVMRKPVPVATAAIIWLIVLGLPFLDINLGRSDERSLPASNSVRAVHDQLRNNFVSNETSAVQVVSTGAVNSPAADIDSYAKSLSQLNGVEYVRTSAGTYAMGAAVAPSGATQQMTEAGMWLTVVPNIESNSRAGERLVQDIRNTDAPFETYVGGSAAILTDLKQSIVDRLPYALLWIGTATFVLLFLMFGSLLVPLKALIINTLSVSAVFGILVWIFQYGNLAGFLGFTPTGSIEATMPILIFCVAFGLSMDYEVFLLSRIKEHHDKTGNNTESVAHGLEMTGGIVTAAALTISVVFLAFATSQVTVIKLIGLGLAIAVLLDAFIIRGTLVPAFMRLAGDANWWAPKFLRPVARRFNLHD
ncbi:MAG: MMPL family transporter [bacterium]|nr:MMPL family transporter [bacterium]